jgi:hypothetical protein
MAKNVSLSLLRDKLRAEIGASANPAMGTNAHHAMNLLLERTQERLWSDFDWPFMQIERDIQLTNGQRYYSFPSDISYDRVNCANVKYANIWRSLEYGVGPKDYNYLDSDRDMRQSPSLKWRHYEENQLEIWPIPADSEMTVRVCGIRNLKPLVADTDVCELDDKLIVLFAAAEMLSHTKSADAPAKLAIANSHYARLRGLASKSEIVQFGSRHHENHRHGLLGGKMPNPQ